MKTVKKIVLSIVVTLGSNYMLAMQDSVMSRILYPDKHPVAQSRLVPGYLGFVSLDTTTNNLVPFTGDSSNVVDVDLALLQTVGYEKLLKMDLAKKLRALFDRELVGAGFKLSDLEHSVKTGNRPLVMLNEKDLDNVVEVESALLQNNFLDYERLIDLRWPAKRYEAHRNYV